LKVSEFFFIKKRDGKEGERGTWNVERNEEKKKKKRGEEKIK